MLNPFAAHNRDAWDDRARRRAWYVDTATDQDFERPLAVVDQCAWIGDVRGKNVLCLAAGGGRHAVLFATAGAAVSVVDVSPAMLEIDRRIAAERRLQIQTFETSMENLSMLGEGVFDVVVQPVSTCYVPDVSIVYSEVARVIKPGGIYVSQHKQPVNLQASAQPFPGGGYLLVEPYHRSGPLPPVPEGLWHREAGTMEFLHRWDQLLGGLCRAGFVIEDVAEPRHGDAAALTGSFHHRSLFVPPYLKIKARRRISVDAPALIGVRAT